MDQLCFMIVEIHDVHPGAWERVEAIRGALAGCGVSRPSLLVVPRFEHEDGRTWDLREHRDFVAWLHARVREGCEIVQHGLTHRAPAPPPAGLRNALMHHCFSRGCAEFAHLSAAEAAGRLAEGRRILERCGLRASGFVAPAWQQSPAAIGAVQRAGFDFTTFLDHVLLLNGCRSRVTSPALTYDTPYTAIDLGKRAVMRCWAGLSHQAPLVRVALHPDDVLAPSRLRHVLRRVAALQRERRLVSYAEWRS